MNRLLLVSRGALFVSIAVAALRRNLCSLQSTARPGSMQALVGALQQQSSRMVHGLQQPCRSFARATCPSQRRSRPLQQPSIGLAEWSLAVLGGLQHSRPRVCCHATISMNASKKAKIKHVCSKCGDVRAQWWGTCQNCKAEGTYEEVLVEPPSAAAQAAPSGAAAAAAALRAGSRNNNSSSSRSGGFGRSSNAFARQSSSYDSYDDSEPDYETDMARSRLRQQQDMYQSPGSAVLQRLAPGGNSWVSVNQAAAPQRLSDIQCNEQQLRLPLLGATGQEVSHVLGGGVVPGSLVLVGGEPGMGKSTLLLQVAGLVAHACGSGSMGNGSTAQQNTPATAAAAVVDDDSDEDMPLSARRSRGAASSNFGSSSSSNSWLEQASAAFGASSNRLLPEGFAGRPVLYVTAEESEKQVWERARRIGLVGQEQQQQLNVWLYVDNNVESIIDKIIELQPAAVVIDSIQTVSLQGVGSRAGSVMQVKECATCLMHVAKTLGCATFLVGHVTKGGHIAGPKHLEHLVDVVLYLQGAAGGGGGSMGGRTGGVRLLRAVKNRHGRVGEVGLFEMHGPGLTAVQDAAALFLPATSAAAEAADMQQGGAGLVGTAIGVVQEGIRALPLEIQALATLRLQQAAEQAADEDTPSDSHLDMDDGSTTDQSEEEYSDEADNSYADNGWDDDFIQSRRRGSEMYNARSAAGSSKELAPMYRHFIGMADKPRMGMLLELLTKYTPVKSHLYNLFLNVVSGYRIPPGETSTDLAILAAVVSSVTNHPLPASTAVLGEVGLAGELRAVPNLESRLLELSRLGFSQAVIPAAGQLALSRDELAGLTVIRQHSLTGALVHLFGEEEIRQAGWRKKSSKGGSSGGSISSSSESGRRSRSSITSSSSPGHSHANSRRGTSSSEAGGTSGVHKQQQQPQQDAEAVGQRQRVWRSSRLQKATK